jgi:hypothetical protein
MIPLLLRHRRALGFVLTLVTIAFIARATLVPSDQNTSGSPWCLVCGAVGGVDVVLNTLLFLPLGIGLAFIGLRPAVAIGGLCMLTFAIEIAQFSLVRGRDASVSDLMTNAIGGTLGFGIGDTAALWLQPTAARARTLAVGWLCGWMAVQSVAAYSIVAAATGSSYFGQIKGANGRRRPFTGDVLSPMIDGIRVPNTRFSAPDSVRNVLNSREGALWAMTVVPSDWPIRLVSIIRVADSSLEEIAFLGQEESDFVFGVRNNAIALHLRPVYFALRDAFPPRDALRPGLDTLRITARYSRRDVTITTETAGATRSTHVRLTPSMGWRFLMPRQVYADSSRESDVFDTAWLTMLLLPATFWIIAALRTSARRGRAILVAATACLIAAGLIAVPAAFGTSGAGIPELAAVTLASVLGFAIGLRAASEERVPSRHA